MIRPCSLLCCCLLTISLRAGDWPEFRGPTAQGIYAGKELPTEWQAGKNIAWKKKIPGLGWSSPAVVEGRIYLTTATPGTVSVSAQSLRALCLDAATGNTIWNQEVFKQSADAPRIQSKNSHASASPLVYAGKVYIHFGHQGSACLNAADGKVIWTSRELHYAPVHGNGGSPVLVDGMLIFSCDGASDSLVAGLDAATGAVKWSKPRTWDSQKKFAFCTPLAIAVDDRKQVVLPGAGGVAAYDPSTGNEIWKVHYSGYSVVPRPAFAHGLVFVSTGFDSPSLLAIRVDGQGDVTRSHVAWTIKNGAPRNASPLVVGDELYMVADSGLASCLDAKSGKVHWQERLAGAYSASPLFANDMVYFLSEQGLTTVVKAAKQFEIVARNALSEKTLASCAAADGALYLRTDQHLYRIEKK